MSGRKRSWLKALLVMAAAAALVAGFATVGLAGKTFGKPIDEKKGTAVELKVLFANLAQYEGKNVIVEGKAVQVCQTSGCWLIVSDGANQLFAQFFDFTVKMPAGGKVRLQGEVRKRNGAPYLVGTGVELQ